MGLKLLYIKDEVSIFIPANHHRAENTIQEVHNKVSSTFYTSFSLALLSTYTANYT